MVKLLRLQLVHPVPQLLSLLPVNTHMNQNECSVTAHCAQNISFKLPQLVLIQMVNVQLLASLGQNLLLLLSFSLLLTSPLGISLYEKYMHESH